MIEDNVKQNSLKAWYLATRPKTLTAALIPIIAACTLAWSDGTFKLSAAAVCAVFASLMQIASNLINDLYDFLKGTDGKERLGPKRATAQGWITPKSMRIGIVITLFLACATGCLLIAQSGMWLVILGAACVLFAFLYTTLLSYNGLGDVLVLVFFGLVPVTATYYLQADTITFEVMVCAFISGIINDTLLVLNNFRDYENDKKAGKRTIIVMLGKTFGKWFYLVLGLVSYALTVLLALRGMWLTAVLTIPYLFLHIGTWRTMVRIGQGRELNRVLGLTSRNMLIFGLLLAIGILLS